MSTARLIATWLLLAVLMVLNGVLREVVLVPQVGAAAAGAISAIVGIAIILGTTGLFFHPLAGAPVARLVRVSAILVALTVVFEFVFGHWVDGKSWPELAGNYAIWNGQLWPLVLASLAIAPFLWGRWVEPRKRAPVLRTGPRPCEHQDRHAVMRIDSRGPQARSDAVVRSK